MDSTAYRSVLQSMRAQVASESSWLPLVLLREDVCCSAEVTSAIGALLSEKSALTSADSPGLPNVLGEHHNSVFPGLFRQSLSVIAARLAGDDGPAAQFRRDGAELLRFLAHALTPRSPRIVDEHDAGSLALLCCLCEGLMHCGCCPSAFEGRVKRAAHVSLALAKKAMIHSSVHQRATVFALISAAFLLAQSTEGILDAPLPSENERANSVFQWSIAGQNANYCVYHSLKPDVFTIVPGSSLYAGHPFRRLDADGATGLTLAIDSVPLKPVSSPEVEVIARARIWGIRRTFQCGPGSEPVLKWINVTQVYESTVYRIDVLSPIAGPLDVEAELVLECPGQVREVGGKRFLFSGRENTVIEFPDDPWGWQPASSTALGTVVFRPPHHVHLTAPTQLTTAWAIGRSVTSINRTNLLGLHA